MWDVWDVGCLGCWGCEMLEIWDVGDLECSGCSGCGMLIYKMPFDDHIKMVFRKISKTIGLLRKLDNFLPRPALITIYKAFIRPILIMVISFMIKHAICLFTKSWNPFSIMHAWPLLEPYEVHRKKSFTKKQVQSLSNYDVGIENQEYFTNSLKAKVHNIF